MAGHSRWAKVKHFKGAIDAKRGRIFSKLAKEIAIAAKLTGGDPDMNPRLRMVLLKCRAANMPSENIERAIEKGVGGDDASIYEDLTYEAYGPHGVAILMELTTDNRNRTVSEIRHAFSKNGGNMGEQGSVAWMFERKSQIYVPSDKAGEDQLMGIVLDAGADDLRDDGDRWMVISPPEAHEAVLKALESNGIPTEDASIAMIPKNLIKLEGKNASAMLRLTEVLEDHDDVQSVFSNFDIDEKELEALA